MTKPVAATGEDGRHLYTCPLCEAMCGLEIEVSDGKVASIRGNRDDTWSRGHICPKGATLGALHEDPDRIRRPMIKVDGQWQEVSWDAAFRRCRRTAAAIRSPTRSAPTNSAPRCAATVRPLPRNSRLLTTVTTRR